MTGREKTAVGAAAVLTMGVTGYSAWRLLGEGILSWHIRQPETGAMMEELAVVWLLLFASILMGNRGWVCGSPASGRQKKLSFVIGTTLFGVTVLAFCWLHEILLPIVLSGFYVAYLILVGKWFSRTFLRKELDICWYFMIGSAVTVSVFCLLSLMQLGSITKLRAWVAASGLCLMIWGGNVLRIRRKNAGGRRTRDAGERRAGGVKCAFGDPRCQRFVPALMLSAIITLLFLQAGRMNIAVDFDSIWYGVRSDVMLDSGNGIYEDLGTLGVVYTYSKGFETLCLPLAGLPSYSFLIAMNIWIAGLVLLAGYRTTRLFLDRQKSLWTPFLMAALPGIMNMAVTAKADLMTVFCQLLMVQGMLRFIKEERSDWLMAGMAAGGLSLTLKPTAVVYSPAIVGMSFLWICFWIFAGKKRRAANGGLSGRAMAVFYRLPPIHNRRIWWMILPSAAALIGIWGRTIRLVGVPVTSVFYGLFQKLGFQVRYPFYASGFPSAGSGQSAGEAFRFLGKRLYGVLLDPQGNDMAHVIIAWGTVLPIVLFMLWVLLREYGAGRKSPQKSAPGEALIPDKNAVGMTAAGSFLAWLLIPLFAVNVVSLYSLSQIDGNYYMLYYALAVLAGVLWMHSISAQKCRAAKGLLLPAWCYAAVICMVTNWAWALGNGGLHPVNRGYDPHQETAHEQRVNQGSGAIWDILAADPKNKVIALGEHPGVLTFPCWVQSYVDVSGYWGNPEVVENAPNFLKYLQFADVDYIYMEKEYVDTSVRIYQIVRSLVADGWLHDVRDENGNLILSVKKDGEAAVGTAMENLRVFDERYIQHP